MENLLHSSSKAGYMEIPVTSMLSPASEISGNTVHTTVDSLESALLLRKGREEETGSKKTSRKADEKLSFLEWKSYWERLEDWGNERDENAWKRKIDAEKQSVNEKRKSHSGIKSKSFSYPPKYHWLLNFHISLYLYTIRHLWLVMSSSSSNTNGTVSRQNSASACAVIKPKQQQEQENEEKESKQWRTTFQAEKKRDKEGTNNTSKFKINTPRQLPIKKNQ